MSLNYTMKTDLRLARNHPQTTSSAGEKRFRDIPQTTAKHHITACFVPYRLETLPGDAELLNKERYRLRTLNPTHPAIPQLNNQIAEQITNSNVEKWRTAVESCNRNLEPGLLWKLIGTMTGKKLRFPSKPTKNLQPKRNHRPKISQPVHSANNSLQCFSIFLIQSHAVWVVNSCTITLCIMTSHLSQQSFRGRHQRM